jgi:hypothetical protein
MVKTRKGPRKNRRQTRRRQVGGGGTVFHRRSDYEPYIIETAGAFMESWIAYRLARGVYKKRPDLGKLIYETSNGNIVRYIQIGSGYQNIKIKILKADLTGLSQDEIKRKLFNIDIIPYKYAKESIGGKIKTGFGKVGSYIKNKYDSAFQGNDD